MCQLSNGEHYEMIDNDQTPLIAHQIQKTINKYVTKGLIIPQPLGVAQFYNLLKILKDLTKPLGQPIMSGKNHCSEYLSQYVDLVLNTPHHSIILQRYQSSTGDTKTTGPAIQCYPYHCRCHSALHQHSQF